MATRILLVFGDPVMLDFYRTSLEAASFRVFPASSAAEALTQAAVVRPDIVVLDGGAIRRSTFCHQLHREPSTRGIPVLALGRPGRGIPPQSAGSGNCDTEFPVPQLPDALVHEIDRQITQARASRASRLSRR